MDPRPRRRNRNGLYAIIIIIIVAAIAAALLFRGNEYVNLSGQKTLTISSTPILVNMKGTYFAISLLSYSNGRARVLVSLMPAFLEPEFSVALSEGNSTHVNLTGKYTNIEIRLNSATSSSANVTLIPVDQSLAIAPDYADISFVNTFISGTQGTGRITVSNSTSTVSSTSTTSSITTTIAQETNTQKVMDVLEKSVYYPLMLNYTAAYADSVNCAPALYNSSYKSYWGKLPSGQSTYQNTSALVPYKMNLSISSAGTNNFAAIYTTYSKKASTSGAALELGINITSNTITAVTLEGVFYGMNYTTLSNGYKKSASIGNACGIYVV